MHLLNEKSQSEMVIYCVIPTVWHCGRGRTMETGKRSGVARAWGQEEGWISGAQRNFRVVKTLCKICGGGGYVSLIVHLSKHTDRLTPRVNPHVTCGLWVRWRVHSGSSMITNAPSGGGGDIGGWGGAVHGWGQGVYGKSLYLQPNFAMNLNCSKK